MIVGNGLIARAFLDVDKEDVIFFASGVSNSLETDENQFLREENLIRKTMAENPGKLFVYFSTCSIYDSSKNGSAYVIHKLNMEHLVSSECEQYLIARVSNAVGKGGNPNLLMNYLCQSILNQQKITIHQNAKRNLIDIEDVRNLILKLIIEKEKNKIYNVAYLENFKISEVVSVFEEELGIETEKERVDLGETYTIDVHEVEGYFTERDGRIYLQGLIQKYFKPSI